CRPSATYAEQVLAEAYPIRLSANRAYESGWYSGTPRFGSSPVLTGDTPQRLGRYNPPRRWQVGIIQP
ncbi:MAG TPA: hypothetical protein VHQ68_12920, partial [Propionibacteriaceae bacterium]|nr:hypothetical protein [Propionibacteriaceae bacterium]